MEREGHTQTHTEMNKPLLLRSHCYSCICNMSFCLHPASCIRSIAPWNSTILIVQVLPYFGQRTMYMQYSVSLLVSKPSFSDTPARRWEETGFLSLLQTFFAPAFSSTREGLERCPNILDTREAPTKSSLSLSLSLSLLSGFVYAVLQVFSKSQTTTESNILPRFRKNVTVFLGFSFFHVVMGLNVLLQFSLVSFPVSLKSWPNFSWTSAFLSRISSDLTLGFYQLVLNVNAFILFYPKHRCVSSQVGLVTQETTLGLQVTENGHIWMWKLDDQDVKPHGSSSGQKDSKVMDLIIKWYLEMMFRRIWLKMGMLAAVSCLRRIPKSPLLQMVLERGHGSN